MRRFFSKNKTFQHSSKQTIQFDTKGELYRKQLVTLV